jgi:hypothetical protein
MPTAFPLLPEKKLIAADVYAHVWQQAVGGRFVKPAALWNMKRLDNFTTSWYII